MNRQRFWPELRQPFVYAVCDHADRRWHAVGHRCDGGAYRRDLNDEVLGRTMTERHAIIPAFPTGQQGASANSLMLDIDHHGQAIDPNDEEWLRAQRELDEITQYIQEHLKGKVDARSYRPGKYLFVPTRYRRDGWDLRTL